MADRDLLMKKNFLHTMCVECGKKHKNNKTLKICEI